MDHQTPPSPHALTLLPPSLFEEGDVNPANRGEVKSQRRKTFSFTVLDKGLNFFGILVCILNML